MVVVYYRPSRQLSMVAILSIIGLGAFVTALDQTVVVTALPSVMVDLKVPITQLDRVSWVITSYLLGYTVAMPLIGRLGDRYGYPRIYQSSLVLFCIGTGLVAVSPNLEWMVGSRVVQAVGGGATVPIGMALAATLAPPGRRTLALGVVGAAAEAGSMLGPVYGGAIVELLTWRWIFWLNIPQSAFIFIALFWLPNRRNPEVQVDYWGGILLIAVLTILSLALSKGHLFTFDSPSPFVMVAMGVGLIAVLAIRERRASQPLLSPLFLRSWIFLSANVVQVLVGVSLIIAMVTVPLLADTVLGKSPFTGALWLLRLTVAILPGALLGAVLVHHLGARLVTVAGLILVAAGMFLASTWDPSITDPKLTMHLLIAGLGFGLVIAPILTQVLTTVAEDYRGTAASLVVVARMMGMTLGLAALSAWGVEHFQVLTEGLEFPLATAGESAGALNVRLVEYSSSVNQAGLSLFQNFFRVAGIVALAAVPATIMMRQGDPKHGVRAV